MEYQLKGVGQIQVNPKIDLTFAHGLRSILRQDPDIIMVGEIRDVETAEIAMQASLTGHLVLSTLHTNDAATAVTRLIDMASSRSWLPLPCRRSWPSVWCESSAPTAAKNTSLSANMQASPCPPSSIGAGAAKSASTWAPWGGSASMNSFPSIRSSAP
nr:ATPase, T2SS/T4P/T4SS family [Geotalea toluenoxydans]